MYVYRMPTGSAAEHLALEEALFHQVSEDLLIFWSHAPAIVCGKYQNIYQEIPVYEAYRRGIPILRRESGGGTVYHDYGNLNYSILVSADRRVDYDPLLADLIFALREVGLPVEKKNTCDIFCQGHKVSGNAQAVRKGRLLHHGTLLYDVDLPTLRMMSARPHRVYTSKAMRSRPAHVANLSDFFERTDAAGASVSIERFDCPGRILSQEPMPKENTIESEEVKKRESGVAQFQEALLSHWRTELLPYSPPDSVWKEARELVTSKYSNREWNLLHAASFTCQAEASFAGKPLSIVYEAKNGYITSCTLTSEKLDKEAGAVLEGVRLYPEEVEQACRRLVGERAFALTAQIL